MALIDRLHKPKALFPTDFSTRKRAVIFHRVFARIKTRLSTFRIFAP